MKFWQVDAFTNKAFKGNPAAIFVVQKALDDAFMQAIAEELNLSETAFVEIKDGQNPYLRWFTPTEEIDLCGHATLASAHIFFSEIDPKLKSITFDTKVSGPLTVTKKDSNYTMQFPILEGKQMELESVNEHVITALKGTSIIEAYDSFCLMLVLDSEDAVRKLKPNKTLLELYKKPIVVTAASSGEYDFISRFFSYHDGCSEDPVTGSSHCVLTPYWSKKLKKKILKTYQASNRGGELSLEILNSNVLISGQAITVVEGVLRPTAIHTS